MNENNNDKKNDSTDISALIELKDYQSKNKDIDDRTSAIDPAALRKAMQAAGAAKKIAIQAKAASRKPESKTKKLLPYLIIFTLTLGAGGWIYLRSQATGNSPMGFFDRLTSPLPWLDDVGDDDFNRLSQATEFPPKAKATLEVAISRTSPQKPIFYIAGNFPDGIQMTFKLEPICSTPLGKCGSPIETVKSASHQLIQVGPIQRPGNQLLPPGQYLLSLAEDDEQSAEVKKALSSYPEPLDDTPTDPLKIKIFRFKKKLDLNGKNSKN